MEKEMATHSSTIAWKIPWTWKRLVGFSPWGCKELDMTEQLHFTSLCYCLLVKSLCRGRRITCAFYYFNASLKAHYGASLVAQTVKNLPAVQETWVRLLGWEDPLEKGMATHSSILAWRIPRTGGVWWAIVQRVRHE